MGPSKDVPLPPIMSLRLQIVFSDGIDMYGEPDNSSAYSLSGHVSISVSTSYSLFESRRPAHLLLQSLQLTFEGQSEVFTQSTSYSSLRLCSINRELVPGEPLELSNEGHEESVWNIVFNLTIPGWLPSSSVESVSGLGVKYFLSARARFVSADGDYATWTPFSALCAPFRPRFRSTETCKPITLRRYINPPSEVLEVPMVNYLVHSNPSGTKKESRDRIPPTVLSSIQVLVSLPEYVDVEATEVPLALRLRTKDLRQEDCERLQLTDVSLDVLQTEQFRSSPNPAYLAQYPIPPKDMQPPHLPLRDSHPVSFIYGEFFTPTRSGETWSHIFSLLPTNESGNFKLGENNYVFKDDRKEEVPTWYTINTALPFVKTVTDSDMGSALSWEDPLCLRPSAYGPLFNVHQQMAVSLSISYDLEGGSVAKDKLNFKIPITFANVAPAIQCPLPSPFLGGPFAANTRGPTSSSSSSSMVLPPYSQLYDQNGERKIDYSVPLPLYTPKAASQRRDDGGDDGESSSRDEQLSLLVDLDEQKEKHPFAALVAGGEVSCFSRFDSRRSSFVRRPSTGGN